MAQRLATEYVKTCLLLSEAQMLEFVRLFQDQQVQLKVKVLENGSQEVVLADLAGNDEVSLMFDRIGSTYICHGGCKLTGLKLTNLMRSAVSAFKGSATVNRLYQGYTMVYQYERGAVVKIVERKEGTETIVYEHKDTLGRLEQLFHNNSVEGEISSIYSQINQLLDLRNENAEGSLQDVIDERLQKLVHRLFVLEA